MFFRVEYRQNIHNERTSRRKVHVVRRGLFMLVSLSVYLAVTVLWISIEWFRLFNYYRYMTIKIQKKHFFIVGVILFVIIALIVGVNIYSTYKYKQNAIEFLSVAKDKIIFRFAFDDEIYIFC